MEDVALVCGWPEWGTASLERTTLPVAGHNQLVLSVEAFALSVHCTNPSSITQTTASCGGHTFTSDF
jgi:hypothetical protein